MNAIQQAEALREHSTKIREIIRHEREASRMTEKQVNDLFFGHMADRGLSAPRAIMTKVRDMRRDFILNRDEAECMAKAIGIGPDPLYPISTSQHELPIEAKTSTKPPATSEAPAAATLPPVERPAATPAVTALPATRTETETSTKVSVGFYETSQGLRFFVNKKLTQTQFDRLTLAIPEYMMQVERMDGMIHCRATVPIFEYQAELLTRAIFGSK